MQDWVGFEPKTFQSPDQVFNHYTTEVPMEKGLKLKKINLIWLLFKLSQLEVIFQLTQYLWFSKFLNVFTAGYYWDVCKVINFETTGIYHFIIQIGSAEINIHADSMFEVLKTSQSFQSFRKPETWILLRNLLDYKVWDNWNFSCYYSNCLNWISYSSWLNVCSSQNFSKISQVLKY